MIDSEKYLDNLPCGKELPADFAKSVEGFLWSPAGKASMAQLETNALIAEKQFLQLDYTDPKTAFTAEILKSRIGAFRDVIDLFINLTQDEEKKDG